MQYKYDYFISYAHKDNQTKDDQPGFVNEFVEKLRDSKEHESMFGEKVSVFFDTAEIKNMTDWDIRIRSSLAHSRFFVVLLSPNYFKSRYCAKEFDWWMQHEMHCRLLGEATAPMKIVTVDEIDNRVPEEPTIPEDLQAEFPNWMKNLQKIQSDYHFDMHDLERAKIDETLKALRLAIEDKVFKQKVAEETPINSGYPEYNKNFVGRRENLRSLRETLSTSCTTAISAVNGLGGIGKTELALTYGHAFAWDYGLGLVFANCEDEDSLDKVLLSCGIAEMHGINLGEGSNQQKLSTLYNELKNKVKSIEERNKENNNEQDKIDKTLGAHLLLILDNVNRPELVSQRQLRTLPDFFHVIITTRESSSKFSHIHTEPVDRLSEDESVELLSNLFPFKDNSEAQAAREIAKLLGGFTLAVEITGAYLKQYEEDASYQEQLVFLSKNLPEGIEEMVKEGPALQQHQAECISVVLQPTLSALTDNSHKALKFASRMSPDAVGLGWLPELVGVEEHERKKIRRQLTGYTLLTPLEGESNIARIHRLVAESLKLSEEEQKEIFAKIRAKCSELLEESGQFWSDSKNYWNITPVFEFIKLLGEKLKTSESPEKVIDWDLTWMMATAGNILKSLEKINEAYEEYLLCYEICIKRRESFPDNIDVDQDFRISRDYLNDLLTILTLRSEKEKASGNAEIAQDLAEKAQKLESILHDTEKEIGPENDLRASSYKANDMEPHDENTSQEDALEVQRQQIDNTQENDWEYGSSRRGVFNFDFYISYAHADNQSEDGKPGFVDAFVEKLVNSKEHQKMFDGQMRVFFDKTEIHSMSEWDNRFRSCLACSRFLIILISPNYFKSEQCAKEFDWWIKHEMEAPLPMLIVSVNDLYNINIDPLPAIPQDIQVKFPNWIKQIRQIQSGSNFDMSNLCREKIDKELQALCQTLKVRVFKQEIAWESPASYWYPRYNENFVGRRENLRSLRQTLLTPTKSSIFALTGLGGMGKTELAITYGHAFAWDYELGRVFVNCENKVSLEEALLSSGIAEMHGLELYGTDEQRLLTLYNALKQRIKLIEQRNKENGIDSTLGAHILLILDNVNRLELISKESLDKLPDFFHVIITTRKSTNEFPYIHTESVDRLSVDESVAFLENQRPFENLEEAEAARKIAKLLEGFPLVVELTGAYLRRHPRETYQKQYERLSVNLQGTMKSMADKTGKLRRHVAETVETMVDSTLSSLSSNARKALCYTAQMLPDAVALSWLPELVGLDEDEGFEVIDELIGYSLLTPLNYDPNIACIPILVTKSVNIKTPEEERKEIIAKLRAKCYDLLHKDISFWYAPENSWNIPPVFGFLKLNANRWSVETSEEEIDWNLTWILGAAGDILKTLDKMNDASEMYRLCCEICNQRVQSFPNNDRISQDLQVSLNKLSDLSKTLDILSEKERGVGNINAARKWYEKSQEIRQKFLDDMPGNVKDAYELGASYSKLGDMERVTGNTNAAREWYGKALEIYERLAEKMPDDIQAQYNLSASYLLPGDLEQSIGNTKAAREWYMKALDIRQKLADKMPDNITAQQALSIIYSRLGDTEKIAGNISAASEWHEKALNICQNLVGKMPEDLHSQLDLSASFSKLGDMEKTTGNTAAAIGWYEKALEIYQRLAEKMPMHTEIQKNLEKTSNQLTAIKSKGWFSSRLKRAEKRNN